MMDDTISRKAAINAIKGLLDSMLETDTIGFYEIENVLFEVPSAQPENVNAVLLKRAINAGIVATNKPDLYSCGMRNGMRWCRAFLEDEYPKFEDASKFAQPEIIHCKECKHWLDIDDGRQKHRMCADIYGDWFCADAERRTDEGN